MASPNYISERQRYIPCIMDTTSATRDAMTDYDTELSDILSRYAVLFKKDDVQAIDNPRTLQVTRRGKKFLQMCQEKFGNLVDEDPRFRILIVNDYRGKRVGCNFDESQKILIFDNNGFLVASPVGFSESDNSDDRSFMTVLDGTIYIAFRHLRYDSTVPAAKDTSCERSKTSSLKFHILGIVVDRQDFIPAATLEVFDQEHDRARSDYYSYPVKTNKSTCDIPEQIGIDFQNPPANAADTRKNRWAASEVAETEVSDYGLFVTLDLKEYATNLLSYMTAHATSPGALTNSEENGGLVIPNGTWSNAAQLCNIYREVARILQDRSEFIFFSAIKEDKYEVKRLDESELWFEFLAADVSSLELDLIKDYKPFCASRNDCLVTFSPTYLPKNSQFFGQSRSKTFTCRLTLDEGMTESGKYSIKSIGDNNLLGNAIEQLKLIDEDHGLYAIPLISYSRPLVINDAGSPLPSDGVPLIKVQAPDVLMWIDGVKMVPNIDYTVENGVNDVFSCQYIKMRRLPGHNAAPTAGDTDVIQDDPMFPKPNDNSQYNITVVIAWPRGNSPKIRSEPGTRGEQDCLLERYIGPYHSGNDPVEARNRQNYYGLYSQNEDVLIHARNEEDNWPIYNIGFDYSRWAMAPVGALSELAILHFHNGRYIPSGYYGARVAGDRVFVSNSRQKNFQDLELHFMLDMKIPKLREIVKHLSSEEGTFDFIFRQTMSAYDVGNTSVLGRAYRWFVNVTTNQFWLPYDQVRNTANSKFYGFARWLNTTPSLQNGSLKIYIMHHGYHEDEMNDVWLDANRNLANDGFRSINVDPSHPETTGEVNDIPTDNEQ